MSVLNKCNKRYGIQGSTLSIIGMCLIPIIIVLVGASLCEPLEDFEGVTQVHIGERFLPFKGQRDSRASSYADFQFMGVTENAIVLSWVRSYNDRGRFYPMDFPITFERNGFEYSTVHIEILELNTGSEGYYIIVKYSIEIGARSQ